MLPMSDAYLQTARAHATSRLHAIVADLSDSERLVAGKAAVYATGSYGRLEAGPRSDLDLFILVATERLADGKPTKPLLSGIDEIKLKCDLIRVNEAHHLPTFDGDGKFLASHSIDSYTRWLGSQDDDHRNTLTGRMLLLLESQPLIGVDLYGVVVEQVIAKYFRDFNGHENDFVPSFLFNDILRMWRTFCVNYEFYRKAGKPSNKIKSLKLKISRMLTCYCGHLSVGDPRQAGGGTSRRRGRHDPYQSHRTACRAWQQRLLGWSAADRIGGSGPRRPRPLFAFPGIDSSSDHEAVAQHVADEAGWRERSYAFGHKLSIIIDILGGISPGAGRLRRLITI